MTTDEQQLKWELEWRDRAAKRYAQVDEWMPDVSLDYAFSDAMTFCASDLDMDHEPVYVRQISPEELEEALGLLRVEPECICTYDQYSPGRRRRTANCPEHGRRDRFDAIRLGHDPNFNPRSAGVDRESLIRVLAQRESEES